MTKKSSRTTSGLRDALFDEIDQLRSGDGDPTKSLAVAKLAQQIIGTAKVELDFHRTIHAMEANKTPITLGSLQLGSAAAASAKQSATDR